MTPRASSRRSPTWASPAWARPSTSNSRVARADLVVTVGVVEPHLYAGFSGGVKGVAIGCAGEETIAWTHRPAFISAPGVVLGRSTAIPSSRRCSEIAARTPLALRASTS